MTDDIIAKIDVATGCQKCGAPLGRSPSDDFCSELCQHRWAEKNAGVVALPFRSETSDLIAAWTQLHNEFIAAVAQLAVEHHWDSGIGQASP